MTMFYPKEKTVKEYTIHDLCRFTKGNQIDEYVITIREGITVDIAELLACEWIMRVKHNPLSVKNGKKTPYSYVFSNPNNREHFSIHLSNIKHLDINNAEEVFDYLRNKESNSFALKNIGLRQSYIPEIRYRIGHIEDFSTEEILNELSERSEKQFQKDKERLSFLNRLKERYKTDNIVNLSDYIAEKIGFRKAG